MKIIKITSANPPQNGIVTHHHDQFMYPVNFNTTNATPRSPKAPIPELLDEFDSLIVYNLLNMLIYTITESHFAHFHSFILSSKYLPLCPQLSHKLPLRLFLLTLRTST